MHYVIRECNTGNCFVYLLLRIIVLLSCSENSVFGDDHGEFADLIASFAEKA